MLLVLINKCLKLKTKPDARGLGKILYILNTMTKNGVCRFYKDDKIFEFLVLESAQAGLSWLTILKRGRITKKLFAGFDPVKVAKFNAKDFKRLMADCRIVRNKLKILAAINNAQRFLEVKKNLARLANICGALSAVNR